MTSLGIDQSRFLGQQHHFQEVGCRVTHGDHVGVADPLPEFGLEALEHLEDGDRLRCGVSPFDGGRNQRPARPEFVQQPAHPLGFLHLAIGFRQLQVAADLIDGIAVSGALLTDVQAGQ